LESLAHLDFKDPQVKLEQLVKRVPRVIEALSDCRVCLAPLGHLVRRVLLVLQEPMENLVHRVLEAHLELMVLLDHLVLLEPLDQEVLRVRKANAAHQEKWDLQDPLGLQESLWAMMQPHYLLF
jgi:hypothetical protein